MSSLPDFSLNNGVKIPAIGMIKHLIPSVNLDQYLTLCPGLGGWAGVSLHEREAARGWFLTALQVRRGPVTGITI